MDRRWTWMAVVAAMLAGVADAGAGEELGRLRERFIAPPPGSGTVTLYWMNGTITKEGIREQLKALRDQCGFGGVAPLTFHAMSPRTRPDYLSEPYFDVYGCILDTAKELGMTVVFYDDCDFPSGSAGDQMRQKHPESLLKYLARGTATVEGPGTASAPVPDGVLMAAVAKNLEDGARRVVTTEAAIVDGPGPWAGGSVGFRAPEEEAAIFEFLRITSADGKALHEETFKGMRALPKEWKNAGASRFVPGGLRVSDCKPTWRPEISLPERFTIQTRLTIEQGAAAVALGVRGMEEFYFWQFNAGAKAIRPHRFTGGRHTLLDPAPFAFEIGKAYEVRLDVDAEKVITRIDGKRIAEHRLRGLRNKAVRWEAPAGKWQLQAFVCATVPGTRVVDYLDPAAVKQFIGLTYEQFRRRFASHFGTTIRMTFFDDLSAMGAPDCLLWTPSFAERFKERYGRSAEVYYPALWEDIGPETRAARVALYTVRNEMFAAGYPGVSEAWCAPLGVKTSGHPAGSYNPTPLQSPGDAILFYKHQGYPLTDYIHYYHHGVDGFVIPAAAAYNYDRPILVCEIYGNFHQKLPNDGNMLYRAGMECYARGVNFLLPHGTWWDPAKMAIVPEISWRNPQIGPELPRFNQWAARCETILRGGRHVADIGIVYPIADLSARFVAAERAPNWGYGALPGTDYFEIIRLLGGEIRRDFTLLHPEIIDERCRVDGSELLLDNQENRERLRVMLLPACRTIHLSNLKKVKAFYDAGGKVVATTCLPEFSAEFGQDAEVQAIAQSMFGPGGRGVFVAKPDERTLKEALDGLGMAWDVRIDGVPEIPRVSRNGKDPYVNQSASNENWYEGGNRQFAYIHKAKAGADFYFFANSSTQRIAADVTLRGRMKLEAWDPHTGAITAVECTPAKVGETDVARVKVELNALRTVFLVARP